jgi:hypothetical protein
MINFNQKENTMNEVVEQKYIAHQKNKIKVWEDIKVGAIMYRNNLNDVIKEERQMQKHHVAMIKKINSAIDYFEIMINSAEHAKKYGADSEFDVNAISIYNISLTQLKKDLIDEKNSYARAERIIELAKERQQQRKRGH